MNKILAILLSFACATTCYAWEAGDQVQSDRECYTLIKELGEGLFGKVFEAKDSKGQSVAIKWYKAKKENMHKFFELYVDFDREFQRGQLFDHPNIIKSIDIFSLLSEETDDFEHFLILEFVQGQTVSATERRSISFNESLVATEHLVEGLLYAFRKGYLHCDLHLNNLMLNKDADAMIIDLASFYSWHELVEYSKTKKMGAAKKGLDIPRADKKLEAFFAENPRLLQMLQEIPDKNVKGLQEVNSAIENLKLYYHSYYFEKITEAVVNIITKSDLEKEKKVAIRAEVKKLSWSFKEDYEDDLITLSSIDDAFNELIAIIKEDHQDLPERGE